ncbi:MAG: hypothetical protein QM518_07620 [Verrucomicrobiota bacterium]|nr:hypothetical protein [Verrucomicrobiota bacterium]
MGFGDKKPGTVAVQTQLGSEVWAGQTPTRTGIDFDVDVDTDFDFDSGRQ